MASLSLVNHLANVPTKLWEQFLLKYKSKHDLTANTKVKKPKAKTEAAQTEKKIERK